MQINLDVLNKILISGKYCLLDLEVRFCCIILQLYIELQRIAFYIIVICCTVLHRTTIFVV